MKFDFAIGNPPYQDTSIGDATNNPPIYHIFMDGAYKIANAVELITPARFLFNAGSTPKAWNEKMLNDNHLMVMKYEADGKNVFPNTDIKGGVAVTYRDNKKNFKSIGTFYRFTSLKSIDSKVSSHSLKYLDSIVYAAESYKFTEKLHIDYPNIEDTFSKGHKYDFKTNTLNKLENIVTYEIKPHNNEKYVLIFGLLNSNRVYRWIKRDYIIPPDNFKYYKLLIPKANGTGSFGEMLSTPVIVDPEVGCTPTFISIGKLDTKSEAESLGLYVKTKFCRTMLGILKITQDNNISAWKKVPLQDFTSSSDIDWSVSISDIDKQLYKKYKLSQEEIDFIETHVKEMN